MAAAQTIGNAWLQQQHGGSDSLGTPRWDFSTNANAAGPCPQALAALAQADAGAYPDPLYQQLRTQLAQLHGVASERIVLGASASELIFRLTAALAQCGARAVCLPHLHYSDYARAAQAWGLQCVADPAGAQLLWACEPSSPLGQSHPGLAAWVAQLQPGQQLVLDCAYAPLRLAGQASLAQAQLARVWQLYSPNKALGLTGVRAAYLLAPATDATVLLRSLELLCPSWPLGAHGVAMLSTWCQSDCQAWLADSLQLLRQWQQRQRRLCAEMGWFCLPSEANFFCARLPVADLAQVLAQLREQGVKLRAGASFSLPPGVVRLRVMAPLAQEALAQAWAQLPP